MRTQGVANARRIGARGVSLTSLIASVTRNSRERALPASLHKVFKSIKGSQAANLDHPRITGKGVAGVHGQRPLAEKGGDSDPERITRINHSDGGLRGASGTLSRTRLPRSSYILAASHNAALLVFG